MPISALPSFAPMCIWRSSPNGLSVTTTFTTTGCALGASAPCSATSFWTSANHSSERNAYFATWSLLQLRKKGFTGCERAGAYRRPAHRVEKRSRLTVRVPGARAPSRFGGHGCHDPDGAHRFARAEPQVAEPAAADRDVGVHQLRHLHPSLPTTVRCHLQPRHRRDHRARALQRLWQVPSARVPGGLHLRGPGLVAAADRLVGRAPGAARPLRLVRVAAGLPPSGSFRRSHFVPAPRLHS